MKIPKVFNDVQSLIKSLREKAENYPLMSKLYISIIEKHVEIYFLDSDADDWLIIPYFQYLHWSMDDNLGLTFRKILQQTEERLSEIKGVLGDSEFEELCQSLFNYVKSPTVYGVLNKLVDFYAELEGMRHYIKRGYSVEIIKKIKGQKTPDFFAKKDNEVIVVECKFIHDSNDIRSYLKRYFTYLGCFSEFNSLRSIPFLEHFYFYYDAKIPINLKPLVINQIKRFVNCIIEGGLKSDSIELEVEPKLKIDYQYEEGIGFGLTSVEFFISRLENFFNEYVLRRTEQASQQFKGYVDFKKVVYIGIEFNAEYNLPWDEMDREKIRMQENLKVKHGYGITLILAPFPPLYSK